MRVALVFSTLAWAAASAQTIVPPRQVASLFPADAKGELKCQVQQLRPVLDFSFRFHAGYTVTVPLSQYSGPGHKWTVGVRIQPEVGGNPVFFVERLDLPPVPQTKLEGETGGGYLLGEGSYRAKFLLMDDLGRGCHAEWPITARLGPTDHDAKLAVAPGTIQETSLRGVRSANAAGLPPLRKLTVLLHAAALSPTQVRASDVVTLLGALSSLLDLAPARSVRLVVFNLDKRQELYRDENFTPDRIGEVRQAIFNLQLGVVDVQTLQDATGHLDMLADLVTQELQAQDPPEAVVFLGPHAWVQDKPPDTIGKPGPHGPKFFYLQYQRPLPPWMVLRNTTAAATGLPDASTPNTGHGAMGGMMGAGAGMGGVGPAPMPGRGLNADLPRDTIDYLVSILKGKTLIVRTPGEFAKAIKLIAPPKGGKSL
jgi:hypothetical protein